MEDQEQYNVQAHPAKKIKEWPHRLVLN
jgi:hypothetical protein